MKNLVLGVLFFSGSVCFAQSARYKQKMAPLYTNGYYINLKNDTVRGQIQTNPESDTEFYSRFYFKAVGKSKATAYAAQRIKAYGFDGRHFVATDVDGSRQYLERLTDGRLRLYEYRYLGKVDGYSDYTADYFIKDTRAEGEKEKLREIRKLPKKFYKKALKPYMEDQLMIWSDLDKYEFTKEGVLNSIKEFNNFYSSGNS